MVRLKDCQQRGMAHPHRNFNSTMVRLKVHRLQRLLFAEVFQFHYGTIKSRVLCSPPAR